MMKTILAALAIVVGVSAGAAGASAGIYDNLPEWQVQVFTASSEHQR